MTASRASGLGPAADFPAHLLAGQRSNAATPPQGPEVVVPLTRPDAPTPSALAAERLDVPPSGVLSGAMTSPVDRARESIGVRIERMFATLGFPPAAQGVKELRISDGKQFTPRVKEELLSRLPVNPREAGPIFERLHQELQQAAAEDNIRGNWGKLSQRPEGLVLELQPF